MLFAQDTLGLRDQGFGILLAMLAVGGWLGPRVHQILSAASTYSLALAVQGIAWLVIVTTQNVYASGASAVSLDAAFFLACVVLVAGAVAFLPAALARRV